MKTPKFARTWQMQDQLSLGKEKERYTAFYILEKYCKPQTILPKQRKSCVCLFHMENVGSLQKVNGSREYSMHVLRITSRSSPLSNTDGRILLFPMKLWWQIGAQLVCASEAEL